MKPPHILAVLLATIMISQSFSEGTQALFVKNDYIQRGNRVTRQTNADQMVQNILQWLQGVYTQNSRRIRQGTLREYLPPSNTLKPRPFEPVTPGSETDTNQGYPPAGSITPQPPFPIYTNPATGGVTGEGYPSPTNEITPPDFNGYPTAGQPQPPFPSSPRPTGYPSGGPSTLPTGESVTGYPGFSTQQPPGLTTNFPVSSPQGFTTGSTEKPGYPTSTPSQGGFTGYPVDRPGFPSPPQGFTTGYPTDKPGFPTQSPSDQPTGYPTQQPSGFTSTPIGSTQSPTDHAAHTDSSVPTGNGPTTSQPYPSEHFTSAVSTTPDNQPAATPSPDENNVIPTDKPKDTGPTDSAPIDSNPEEDLKHPPHIHAIDVQCAKDMMTINIEFNRKFEGVIYSKGYYNMPECRYVKENSGLTKYSFTVNLNTCGTEFINAFDTQGLSYLENVLVLQNEPGIQEVWDTIRSVRCLWEGNLKESLSVALSVGMLSQEIVTFSGDTAMAKLDILTGKGPLGQPANGLVKIGEPMTLVVSVSGDPGFDIQVKDCRATDSTGDNVVPLTDDNGCVLKPKLFGAFQKARNTGITGVSIIAYAYFSAFKFPDVMDLMIECNIELCKTDCEMCTEPNQKIDPGRRRRRDLYSFNHSLADGVTMGKHLRVILPEDLTNGKTIINLNQTDGICMSTEHFVFSSALLISLLATSCLFSAYMWLKNQRMSFKH